MLDNYNLGLSRSANTRYCNFPVYSRPYIHINSIAFDNQNKSQSTLNIKKKQVYNYQLDPYGTCYLNQFNVALSVVCLAVKPPPSHPSSLLDPN